jgi:hypothetical protein
LEGIEEARFLVHSRLLEYLHSYRVVRQAICADPSQRVAHEAKVHNRLQDFCSIVAAQEVRMQVVVNPSQPTVLGNSEGYRADTPVIFAAYHDEGIVGTRLLVRLPDALRYIFPGLMLT